MVGAAMALTAYGFPIATVPYFKHFDRIMLTSDDDWPAVVHNLSKAWKKWERLSWLMVR